MKSSNYDDIDEIAAVVARGEHRRVVGGLWDEMGRMQLEFLRAHGLEPVHRLLDIGCGCLRAGVHLAAFLEPGHYWGTDINASLLDAGHAVELAGAGLAGRVPRAQLVCDAEFAFPGIDATFDVAIAQSVFTHLPFNHLRVCLERLPRLLRPGGRLFATYFGIPDGRPTYEPFRQQPGPVRSQGARDPFHYRTADLEYAARGLPWRLEDIGDWDHPRGQRMACFHRCEDS